MSRPLLFLASSARPLQRSFPENFPSSMKKAPNSNHLSEHISRALNKIRKPSTAGEITELLNRDLAQRDRPFQETDGTEWLRNTEDAALTLSWSKARPRK
jgi:hypothetical protein